MKAIFHIHTKHSFDSLLSPRRVVDYAAKHDIQCVMITDHDGIMGAVEARDYAEQRGIPVSVVIGAEMETDAGDIIGIFLTRDITSYKYRNVVADIRSQGGLVVLPHPFSGHDMSKIERCPDLDFVETFNSRTSRQQDGWARSFARNHGLKQIGGSDAHLARELGNCVLEFEYIKDFPNGPMWGWSRKARRTDVYISQLIKMWRQR